MKMPAQPKDMEHIRTIIADDHHLFITGLSSILKDSDLYEFDIVSLAHDGDELMEKLKLYNPDFLVLDLNMPGKDGLDVLKDIRKNNRELKILTLTMYDEPKIVKAAFKSGSDGYVLKNEGKEGLLKGVHEVMSGRTHLGVGVKLNEELITSNGQVLARSVSPYEDRFIQKYNLTKREIEILRLITQALSNKEIAKELYISDQTVSVHRKNIMRKLGVSNTAGLIKLAYDNSLV